MDMPLLAGGSDNYIIDMFAENAKSGNAYIPEDELVSKCLREHRTLPREQIKTDTASLVQGGFLYKEGQRLYLPEIWRYETSAAEFLSEILMHNTIYNARLTQLLWRKDTYLDATQRMAVVMALTHRISMILGGGGTGKSTLIKTIVENRQRKDEGFIICAPTGKAAQNLREKLNLPACTVHSALGQTPGASFLSSAKWEGTSLVIVDEASMLTLGMLAGLLCRTNQNCCIVLLGDPNQLLSVGTGNVLPDLMKIGVPFVYLDKVYRQYSDKTALYHNVSRFPELPSIDNLRFDESFLLWEVPSGRIRKTICDEAAKRYSAGENVQVLSPANIETNLSVNALNRELHRLVNPPTDHTPTLQYGESTYYNGDKVMILHNDNVRACCNGDIGILQIPIGKDHDEKGFSVNMPSQRRAVWPDASGLGNLTLAYALTVHKSQGSQYDTVILPVSVYLAKMMHRNLLYTAISRARERVILVGERQGLADAMKRRPPGRIPC